jgi:hypothetical protein
MRATTLLLDVLVVLVFAVVGRASHAEGVSVLGVLEVAWPFLAGMLGGWLVAVGLIQVAMSSVRGGALVWVVTVAGGMAVRALTGQGTAPAFVVVATLALGLGLVGWRLVLRWVR